MAALVSGGGDEVPELGVGCAGLLLACWVGCCCAGAGCCPGAGCWVVPGFVSVVDLWDAVCEGRRGLGFGLVGVDSVSGGGVVVADSVLGGGVSTGGVVG